MRMSEEQLALINAARELREIANSDCDTDSEEYNYQLWVSISDVVNALDKWEQLP